VRLPSRKLTRRLALGLLTVLVLAGAVFLYLFPWAFDNQAIAGVEGPQIVRVTYNAPKGDVGAAAYGRTCGYCHDSNIGPSLRGRGLDPEAVKYIVRHGSRAMPAFRPSVISDAELDAIAALVASNHLPERSK
jgi:mono/diheme cytochrome c family protein